MLKNLFQHKSWWLVALLVIALLLFRPHTPQNAVLLEELKQKYQKDVRDALAYWKKTDGVSIPESRIYAIIATEGWNEDPASTGRAGEVGPMQVTPVAFNDQVKNGRAAGNFNTLREIRANIFQGIGYLSAQLVKQGSLDNATKAYNVGPDLKPADKAIEYLNRVTNFETSFT